MYTQEHTHKAKCTKVCEATSLKTYDSLPNLVGISPTWCTQQIKTHSTSKINPFTILTLNTVNTSAFSSYNMRSTSAHMLKDIRQKKYKSSKGVTSSSDIQSCQQQREDCAHACPNTNKVMSLTLTKQNVSWDHHVFSSEQKPQSCLFGPPVKTPLLSCTL